MDGVFGFVTLFAGDYAPRHWAFCDGSLLPISVHQGLFKVIGTTYGGDGKKTFALPDLRGRAVKGAGEGISVYTPGEVGGFESIMLRTKNIPAHTHPVQVTITPHAAGVANSTSPVNAVYATNPNQQLYEFSGDVEMASYTAKITTSAEGTAGTIPVPVLHPVLALNYIICLKGDFPNRH